MTEFQYGWCHTDHKDGKQIMRARPDYVLGAPHTEKLRDMLDKLGLPFPEEHQIYRGTNHDMLFLNSHGVILRIGPLEMDDYIHPCVLQPLGYVQDKDPAYPLSPFVVAIYPGVALPAKGYTRRSTYTLINSTDRIMGQTGFVGYDMHRDNVGIIPIVDEDEKELGVEMAIDVDSQSIYPLDRRKHEDLLEDMRDAEKELGNRALAMEQSISKAFNKVSQLDAWRKAMRTHLPLRVMFWDAFKDPDKPDVEKLSAFWKACADAVNTLPQPITVPSWRAIDSEGADQTRFERYEALILSPSLYRAWTGKLKDQNIPAIPEDLCKAIAKAHKEAFPIPKSKAPGAKNG